MQEKENPTDYAVAYRWGLTHSGAKRLLFKEKLSYQRSAFSLHFLLFHRQYCDLPLLVFGGIVTDILAVLNEAGMKIASDIDNIRLD